MRRLVLAFSLCAIVGVATSATAPAAPGRPVAVATARRAFAAQHLLLIPDVNGRTSLRLESYGVHLGHRFDTSGSLDVFRSTSAARAWLRHPTYGGMVVYLSPTFYEVANVLVGVPSPPRRGGSARLRRDIRLVRERMLRALRSLGKPVRVV